MRSIIDEIALAEQQADQIRQQAVAAARERVSAAGEEAEKAMAVLDEAERLKTRNALEKAEQEGEGMAVELRARMEQDADALCRLAGGRVDACVDYLLKKVRETA